MEALAARQLQKQKTASSLNTPPTSAKVQSPQERLALNRLLGFADPPAQVFALGKEECAAVWWTLSVDDESITGWEVHRYRKDKSRPGEDVWHYKGYISYETLVKNQTIIDQLSNDYEYRFTVKSINAKGVGLESAPSNPVMVEKPLPVGWYRFLDKTTKRHYYANVRLNASSWTRPELDPWFLDEAIVLNFQAREIEALKNLYKEEIAHFGCVSIEQFMDVLREIGERCSVSWITQLFRGYAESDKSLKSWKHFMEVLNHIKKYRTSGIVVVQNPFEKLIMIFRRQRVGALLQPKAEKMGEWVVEYSSLAERNFYRNTKTGETYWSMPPQVKFYIPPKLEDKLLTAFDYGDLEEFQQYFSMLDIDNSGDLSGKEIRVLLRALDIKISELKFNKLLKTVDLNGNGTIEFDEYCWMMLQIFRKDNGGLWGELRAKKKAATPTVTSPMEDNSGYLQQQAEASAGSLENSLFGDQAWENKLSYRRMRTVLNTMKQFTAAGSKGRRGRFSISGSGSAGVFTSLRRMSLFSGGGRQNSLNDMSEDNSDATKSSLFACFRRKPKTGNASKLNAVLSKYEEGEDVPAGTAPLYPPASFSRKASVKSIKFGAGTKEGTKDRDEILSQVGSEAQSVLGVAGSAAASDAQSVGSAPRQSRRVSFSASGQATALQGSPGGASVSRKSILAGGSGGSSKVVPTDSPAMDAGSRKGRRGSNGSLTSLGSGGSRSKQGNAGTKGRRSSGSKRGKPSKDEDLSDSGSEGDGPIQEGDEGDGADDRSVVSITAMFKRVSSFAMLSGGSGAESEDPNVHPKYCMCGCRAY